MTYNRALFTGCTDTDCETCFGEKPSLNPRELKPDEIVAFGSYFFEVTQLTEHGVRLSTLSTSMVSEGGLLRFEDKQWAGVRRPKGKDLRQIAAIKAKRERNMPHMHHDAARLPDGTVHVQNWISGMYGGLGQHHVHTAEEFAAWSKDIDPKYLKVTDGKCSCGLAPGQTREYDGKVWSKAHGEDGDQQTRRAWNFHVEEKTARPGGRGTR